MLPLLDSSTWIAVGSAAAAAVVAAVVCALVFVVLARGRRKTSTEFEQLLASSNERFEELIARLARDLERAHEETRRSRQLAAIGATIDLDTVLARVLEAATAVEVIDAVMIVVTSEGDDPVVATSGMTADEAASHPVAAPPVESEARAVGVSYRYAAEGTGEGDRIRGGLVLPLASDAGEAVGTLAAFWRATRREPSDEEIETLEEIVQNAGPAIENARRFREARKLADLDALTGLHNRRYFHDTLSREVARAQRYTRKLALVVIDIDDFKAVNERVGHLAGDAVLAQLAEWVRSVVRSADIACRVGGDEFAVILPESGLGDAEQLYRRLQSAVSRSTGTVERLRLSAGIAELAPEDDAVSFFERADEALFKAKETGKGQAVAAEGAQ